MENKRYGSLSSSVNPQELSLTVTSSAQMMVSLAVAFGWLTATGAESILEQIPVIVATGYATYQGCLVLYGAVRKVIVAVTARY